MKSPKIPVRTCVISRESYPKKELTRIVTNKDGEINVDPSGKMNGRGIYIKLSKENLEKSRKKKILEKMLKISDASDIYSQLEKLCDE